MQSGKRLVEADWTLLHTCNYRCEYCFVPRSMLGEKIRIRASNEEWAEAFDRHDVKWHIHITGGEPTAYPDFAGLCEHLTINNLISLNSNLTGKSLENFVKRINPERVVFINGGLHYTERMGRSGLEDFLTRARQLTDSGFNLMISAVTTPEFITNAEAVRQRLRKNGIIMAPKILRGNFSGRVWPHAYSKDQRKLIFRFLDLAERELERLQERGGHQLTIDLRLDRTLLGEGAGFIYKLRDTFSKTAALEKMFHGRLCGAGLSFVSIDAEGDVHRCSNKRYLGNLLKTTFRFLREVQTCDTAYCPYFCFKHTSEPVLSQFRTLQFEKSDQACG